MIPTHVMNELGESFFHRSFLGRTVIGGIKGLFDIGGGGGAPALPTFGPSGPCGPGQLKIPGTEFCIEPPIIPTLTGTGETFAPTGPVTPGAFGALSVDPVMMSTVRLRCPTGLVLGKDDRCYAQGKGGISNSQRKWPKAPRAIMSAQDGKILRKADAVRGRVKRVAATAGFTCKKK